MTFQAQVAHTFEKVGPADSRRMIRSELMGAHSHSTLCGVKVHVWRRGGKFLARGRFHGQPFGPILTSTPVSSV